MSPVQQSITEIQLELPLSLLKFPIQIECYFHSMPNPSFKFWSKNPQQKELRLQFQRFQVAYSAQTAQPTRLPSTICPKYKDFVCQSKCSRKEKLAVSVSSICLFIYRQLGHRVQLRVTMGEKGYYFCINSKMFQCCSMMRERSLCIFQQKLAIDISGILKASCNAQYSLMQLQAFLVQWNLLMLSGCAWEGCWWQAKKEWVVLLDVIIMSSKQIKQSNLNNQQFKQFCLKRICAFQSFTVFSISIVTVRGPTPPGTGVDSRQSRFASSRMSPFSLLLLFRLIPISIAIELYLSWVIRLGFPTAEITISAWLVS